MVKRRPIIKEKRFVVEFVENCIINHNHRRHHHFIISDVIDIQIFLFSVGLFDYQRKAVTINEKFEANMQTKTKTHQKRSFYTVCLVVDQ